MVCCSFNGQNCLAQKSWVGVKTLKGQFITAQTLDRKMDSLLTATAIPGLSLAIVNDSSLVYHNTFGVVNSATAQPVDDSTIFEGASLSKPIFAYFALKMAEEGVLNLDEPLHNYLPHKNIADSSLKDYKSITARMVLSHRSGFPNHAHGQEITLSFKPGTDFLYSGEGYQYLAEVIAHLKGVDTGTQLNALFQEYVTGPLDMPHSTFVWNSYLAAHKASGHNLSNKPTQKSTPSSPNHPKKFHAYSSLHTEAYEYAQFLVALIRAEGLKKTRIKEMLSEHTRFKDDNPLKIQIGQTGWGLGMAQKPTEYGMMHMHTGNNHDFQSYMMILPERGFGIVFFINCGKAIPFIQGLNSVIGPIY